MYLLNSHLAHLASQELLKRFEQCELGLRLYFDQESRWRYTLDFKLLKQDKKNTLIFIPMIQKYHHPMYFYTSKMLRRPMLYKVSLISSKESGDQFKNIPDNLLNKSYPIDIKQLGQFQSTIPIHHQHQDLSLLYTVHETPSHIIKKRPGERTIFPHAFQCDLDWLCQTKSFFSKWVDILHNKPQPRPMSDHLHFTMTEKLPMHGGTIHNQSQIGQVAEINTIHPMLINHHHLTHKSSVGTATLVPNLLGH